jgi:hypothetical protein
MAASALDERTRGKATDGDIERQTSLNVRAEMLVGEPPAEVPAANGGTALEREPGHGTPKTDLEEQRFPRRVSGEDSMLKDVNVINVLARLLDGEGRFVAQHRTP